MNQESGNEPASNTESGHRFQVDLRGLIDLLSQHLYSGPSVYIRELLQNGVDAIEARRTIEPDHVGFIELEVMSGGGNTESAHPATLLFRDNGVGLTEDESHRFLATIGMSSKRGQLTSRNEGFLGQFGIGLLSCFLVCEDIVVISKSARSAEAKPVEWRGSSDGTYSVRTIERDMLPGTQIYLRAKPTGEEWITVDRVRELAQRYGRYLEHRIQFSVDGRVEEINEIPLWDRQTEDEAEREDLLGVGAELFERKFLDVFPLKSASGQVDGLAYVLAQSAHARSSQTHRAYLKGMLLSENSPSILPEWAFFVQCIVNVRGLRPTASRESFYEDEKLENTREELGQCLRRYLIDLSQRDPHRLQHFIDIHHVAIKALAIEDDECLRIFADWLPFETSAGTMTLAEYRKRHAVIRYVSTRDLFRQISQVAAAEAFDVINAGYVYDTQVLKRLAELTDVVIQPFDADELSDRFEPLDRNEQEEVAALEALADEVLQTYDCSAEVVKFQPSELPALFITNESADFLRSVEQSQEEADELWSGILSGIAKDVSAKSRARLHLNYHNALVRRIGRMEPSTVDMQKRCIELLYVQSLLMGHFPLRSREVELLNSGLLGLIDWATS